MTETFDEQDELTQEPTPSLEEVITKAMENAAYKLNVGVPAEVIRYDRKKQLVDVRPDFNKKYKDGKIEEAPVIYNVPVKFQRAGQSIIAMPIKVGHKVNLHFQDRSLEKWKSSGTRGHPDDTRAHHTSDCFAFPGGYPFSDSVPLANDDDIIIRNQKDKNSKQRVEVRIKPNGHIQILNNKEELVKVLDDLITYLREAKVYTSTGALRLRHSKFESGQKRLRTFLEK